MLNVLDRRRNFDIFNSIQNDHGTWYWSGDRHKIRDQIYIDSDLALISNRSKLDEFRHNAYRI